MVRRVSIWFLRFTLGLFFIVLGILGIMPELDELFFSLRDIRWLEMVFGLVELFCGFYLLLGCFVRYRRHVTHTVGWIVLVAWIARVALTSVVWGLSFGSKSISFNIRGGFWIWAFELAIGLVIAAGLGLFVAATDD